jgi:hypothetical protein
MDERYRDNGVKAEGYSEKEIEFHRQVERCP